MKKRIHKINSARGFSLVELLVAILIVSMVAAVVAGGIPVAKNAYKKVTVAANAQVMLSTTITALRNELCTAGDVTILDESGAAVAESTDESGNATGITAGEVIHYYSPSIKNYSTLSIGLSDQDEEDDPESILLTQYADSNSSSKLSRRLVSKASGDNQLYVTYEEVSYDKNKGIITISNLKVMDESETVFAELDEDDPVIKIRLFD